MSLLTFSECQTNLLFVFGGYMGEKIGIIKDIDRVGRIVIPKDFRERMKLSNKVELVLTEEGLLIRKPKETEEVKYP